MAPKNTGSEDSTAADEKDFPKWAKNSGWAAIVILMGGGASWFTGSNAVAELQKRFSDFEGKVNERLVRLEVKLGTVEEKIQSQDAHWMLTVENKIRQMVRSESLK